MDECDRPQAFLHAHRSRRHLQLYLQPCRNVDSRISCIFWSSHDSCNLCDKPSAPPSEESICVVKLSKATSGAPRSRPVRLPSVASHPRSVAGSFAILSAAALILRGNRFGYILLLALLGYAVGFQESTNLWDYLLDPVYGAVALLAVLWMLGRRITRKSR